LVFRFRARAPEHTPPPPVRLGAGAVGVVLAGGLVLALRDPALPVLALGLGVTAWRRTRPEIGARTLAALFAFAVALGALARTPRGLPLSPRRAVRGSPATAAAAGSLLLNNLPAAVLLSAHPSTHPAALLIGLDLGPNAAVTGSLAAVLWLRVGRALGAD